MIRIITLWRKEPYVQDAIQSVRQQTRSHDVIHVLQHDDGTRDWNNRYPVGVFWNEAMAAANVDDYLGWLSDDDLLLPNYVEDLAGYLDRHEAIDCCYGGSQLQYWDENGKIRDVEFQPAGGYVIYNAQCLPGCQIDGGQFMIRRSALELVERPWCPEDRTADPNMPAIMLPERYGDAIFMNKIANAVGMYPIGKQVMIRRETPLGTHTKIIGGQRVIVDWRQDERRG